MKVRVALMVCAGLVAVVAVLSAQSNVVLDPQFESKLRALEPGDAQGHFKLALSAFKDNLYEEAKAAAAGLLALDKGDTRAVYLKGAAEFYQGGGFQPGAIVTTTTPTKPERPKTRPTVVDLTDEEVNQVYAGYGQARLNEFRGLQTAIFLRRCATDQCHGNPETSGRFLLKTKDANTRKTLAENFRMVKFYINDSNLATSRILSVTLDGPDKHPGGPVFRSERDAMYQRLKKWVEGFPGLFGGP